MIFRTGCHVSIAGSHEKAFLRAEDIGCNTFQIFTGNPRGWSAKEIDDKTALNFRDASDSYDMSPVIAHMPYLPNFASPKDDVYEKSCSVLKRELDRCKNLGIPYLVTHLGSHLGKGREFGVERIASAVSKALSKSEGDVMILLENTSGTKNSVGGPFEDINEILQRTDGESIGVCLDTCHAFAQGYDLSKRDGVYDVVSDFDKVIGLKHLKVIHLNDTKGELGSHLDRHEHIGLGRIGDEGLGAVVTHPKLRNLPFICETPVDERRDDKGNLAHVRELAGEGFPP